MHATCKVSARTLGKIHPCRKGHKHPVCKTGFLTLQPVKMICSLEDASSYFEIKWRMAQNALEGPLRRRKYGRAEQIDRKMSKIEISASCKGPYWPDGEQGRLHK